MIGILNFLVGLTLLTLGRRLFWLFVGCVGFAVGFNYAQQMWGTGPGMGIVLLALAAGLLGAILAIFAQGVTIALAGFFAGAYVAANLVSLFTIEAAQFFWVFYVVGGVVGALLLFAVFDWALIILSSLMGATLIVQLIHLGPFLKGAVFLVLIIAGIVFQTTILAGRPPEKIR